MGTSAGYLSIKSYNIGTKIPVTNEQDKTEASQNIQPTINNYIKYTINNGKNNYLIQTIHTSYFVRKDYPNS